MNSIQDRIPLQNGTSIPCMGFGTWKMPADVATNAVLEAIHAGYRHIDTATAYKNEEAVGAGIRASGVAREDLFVTTKLWNPDQGYTATLAACDRSLQQLGMDYLDLYLIHWPHDRKYFDNWEEMNAETWRAFEELYQSGKVRAIGLSNFRPHHVDNILQHCSVRPMVDQVEIHPGMPQDEMLAYCREQNMLVEAWSPLSTGKIFSVPELQALAEKYGKSIAQVCLRWHVQRGILPIPKSVTPSRIAENAQVFDFALDDADMAAISALTDCGYSGLDPDNLIY